MSASKMKPKLSSTAWIDGAIAQLEDKIKSQDEELTRLYDYLSDQPSGLEGFEAYCEGLDGGD